jgi:hypothetical protein
LALLAVGVNVVVPWNRVVVATVKGPLKVKDPCLV